MLGAVALVLLGRLALWVGGWPCWRRSPVNPSAQPGADYVAQHDHSSVSSTPFQQEQEPEREPDRAEPAEPPPPSADRKLYSAEQIRTLQEQAREAGAAEALGRLLGRQLLDADDRTQAMELLFGPRGRRHQRVRPLVEVAAASVAPPDAEARLIPIKGGDEGLCGAVRASH